MEQWLRLTKQSEKDLRKKTEKRLLDHCDYSVIDCQFVCCPVRHWQGSPYHFVPQCHLWFVLVACLSRSVSASSWAISNASGKYWIVAILILGIGPVSLHIRVIKQLESLVYPQSCLSAHCHKSCTNTNLRVLYCETILGATTVNSSTKTLPAIATNGMKKVAVDSFRRKWRVSVQIIQWGGNVRAFQW